MKGFLGIIGIISLIFIFVWIILIIKQRFFNHKKISTNLKKLGFVGPILLLIGSFSDGTLKSFFGVSFLIGVSFVLIWLILYLFHRMGKVDALSIYSKYLGWIGLIIIIISLIF